MISACPDSRISNALRIAMRSAVCLTTGKEWYERKTQVMNPPLKYSDFAMLHESPRGKNAGTIGGTRFAGGLGQMMTGPLRGTFSAPITLQKPTRYVRALGPMSQRLNAEVTAISLPARRYARS